jgi:hypothetical protein
MALARDGIHELLLGRGADGGYSPDVAADIAVVAA